MNNRRTESVYGATIGIQLKTYGKKKHRQIELERMKYFYIISDKNRLNAWATLLICTFA